LPSDRERLIAIISEGEVFRPEEISCAIELLDGAYDPSDDNPYEVRVAVDDGQRPELVLGYTCFGSTPMTEATFDLYWVVVAASARGRGIGKALMDATEDELRRRGGQTLRIETSSLEGQGGAARFYARAGYERVGAIADFYRPGDDLLIFAKRLAKTP
jgi:ribosomal protein S18 acetylase RimI-like enzyme